MKMNRKGFTIVELVIVIAVIAILAAVMIPTFSSIVSKANASKALQEVKAAYTVYLADSLTDADDNTPIAGDIIVVHDNGTIIKISSGNAEVVASGTANLSIYTKANGDKSLH